jgi:D-alanine-D-alanine ligase
MVYEGLPTPDSFLAEKNQLSGAEANVLVSQIIAKLGLPVVVKPTKEGSSIGMSVVYEESQLPAALNLAFEYDEKAALVEKFIPGKEIHAAVLGNEHPIALPLIEVDAVNGVYDYEAKYTAGMSKHTIPPLLPEALQKTVQDLAVRSFTAFDCRGLARVDFRVDPQGNPYILELNTIPGLTPTSLCPEAAQAAGIEFPALVEQMIQLALE